MYSITGYYYARAMHPSAFSFEMCFLQQEEGLRNMARFLHPFDFFTFRKKPLWLLAFSWLLGLGAGGVIFRYSGEHILSLMPLAALGQLSIVSLFLRTSLPFLLTAFAVSVSWLPVLPVIGFFRALLYGYVLCGVFGAFGAYGWLIRWLLLFTDTFGCVLLYWYMSRYASGIRGFSLQGFGCCEMLLGLLISFDFYVVSPFLRQILS